jgi:hypothetical protein
MSNRQSSGAVLEAIKVEDPPTERRGSARSPYHREQRIAPYFAQDELDPTDFCPVFCIDISATGMSFFWPRVPAFQAFVVRLGDGEPYVDMIASVRWHSPQSTAAGYIIGCEFTGQMSD